MSALGSTPFPLGVFFPGFSDRKDGCALMNVTRGGIPLIPLTVVDFFVQSL